MRRMPSNSPTKNQSQRPILRNLRTHPDCAHRASLRSSFYAPHFEVHQSRLQSVCEQNHSSHWKYYEIEKKVVGRLRSSTPYCRRPISMKSKSSTSMEPLTLTVAFRSGRGGYRQHAGGKTNSCCKCGAFYKDSIAAGYCCAMVDQKMKPKGECYWCGDTLPDWKERQLFCHRACGESFLEDELYGNTMLGIQS